MFISCQNEKINCDEYLINVWHFKGCSGYFKHNKYDLYTVIHASLLNQHWYSSLFIHYLFNLLSTLQISVTMKEQHVGEMCCGCLDDVNKIHLQTRLGFHVD